jgi:hypothetical protein
MREPPAPNGNTALHIELERAAVIRPTGAGAGSGSTTTGSGENELMRPDGRPADDPQTTWR